MFQAICFIQARFVKSEVQISTERSDQPLGQAVLPGRAWCNGLVMNAFARNRHVTAAPRPGPNRGAGRGASHGWNNEQVYGLDIRCMVVQEGEPPPEKEPHLA